jgi:hypothetical protein
MNEKHNNGTCGGEGICITCSAHINRHIVRPRTDAVSETKISWLRRLDDIPVFRN